MSKILLRVFGYALVSVPIVSVIVVPVILLGVVNTMLVWSVGFLCSFVLVTGICLLCIGERKAAQQVIQTQEVVRGDPEQNVFYLNDNDYRKLTKTIAEPRKPNDKLRQLMRRTPAWDR